MIGIFKFDKQGVLTTLHPLVGLRIRPFADEQLVPRFAILK